jgi:uncharacterized protein (DUF1778 family)
MACKPGDLVLIPFPFSDLQSAKKRPKQALAEVEGAKIASLEAAGGRGSRSRRRVTDSRTSLSRRIGLVARPGSRKGRYGHQAMTFVFSKHVLKELDDCPCHVFVFTSCAHFMYSDCIYKEAAMARTEVREATGRNETINLRASQKQKALIDRAAEALGRSRSDFMLETVCREAETVLLDRRYFALSQDAFKRFTAMLDDPPASNPKLRRLLQTRAPWER